MPSPDSNDCRKNKPSTLGILFVAVMVLCLWVLFFVLKAVQIPPETISSGSIIAMAENICKYYVDNRHLPDQNEYIEYIKLFPNLDDAWERPIKYRKRGASEFLLYSLGKDNSIGGDGQDKDMVYIYSINKEYKGDVFLDDSWGTVMKGSTDDLGLTSDDAEVLESRDTLPNTDSPSGHPA